MATKPSANVQETTIKSLWQGYKKLNPEQKRKLAGRILRDEELLEDFLDNALIEEAKRVKGKPILWEEFKTKMNPRC